MQTSDNPFKDARERLEQAESFRRQGKYNQAEKICIGLLNQHPNYFAALHTLGLTYADKKESARALGPLFQAATLNPNSWITLTALSGVCLNLHAGEMAAQILERARLLKPNDPTVLATLGLIYRQEREYELSRDAFLEALKRQPEFLDASMGLARTYISLGDDADAARVIKPLLARGIHSLDMLTTVIHLPEDLIDIDLMDAVKKPVSRHDGLRRDKTEELAFVKAHAHDRRSEFEEACEELRVANRIYANRLQDQLAKMRERQKYSLLWLEKRAPGTGITTRGVPLTLFIFGPSRSGKTTLERLVFGLDGVKRGFENSGPENAINRTFQDAGLITSWSLEHLPPQFYPQFQMNYVEELQRRAGSAKVFTNTHPAYMQNAAEFADHIPNCRFIFVKRNIDDLTLRIYMRSYQSGNAYAYDISTIREHIAWYQKMMDLMAEKFPDIVRIVTYEDMATDAKGVLKTAAALCGLPAPEGEIGTIFDDRNCADPYRELLAL
uniref:tetratricopeptide repeat-containing sulfotransferase family protein n=1 Tax=Pararhizobium sp. IMCC3301 TaxID=3067904 RepID=UPI0027414A6E|nr:tetratricopeptide repeat-containing sulfotransferase family protein [Pararhizobium sp. IMCC3301]